MLCISQVDDTKAGNTESPKDRFLKSPTKICSLVKEPRKRKSNKMEITDKVSNAIRVHRDAEAPLHARPHILNGELKIPILLSEEDASNSAGQYQRSTRRE